MAEEKLPCLMLPADFPADEIPFLAQVARERVAQIRSRGYGVDQDARYRDGELACASAAYIAGPHRPALSALLWPWPAVVQRWLRTVVGGPRFDAATDYLTRKPRGEQLVVGVALAVAEAGRRARAGET